MYNRSGKNISFKSFKVNPNNYQVDKDFKVKTGAFGKIYVVKDSEGKIYAAKVLTNNNKEELKSQLEQEIANLIYCQHPTVIKIYGYSSIDIHQNNNYTIYMEYAKKGSLADYIYKEESIENLSNTQLQIILAGIAYGMMIIHKKGYLHLDIKPQNILLDENFHPLIADFGNSEKIGPNTLYETCKGTPAYMAPEILNNEQYNEKVDVYSFGVLMYEVVYKKHAYPDVKGGQAAFYKIMQKAINGERPKFKHKTNKWIKNLIKRCWSSKPNERPDFNEIFVRLTENNGSFKSDIIEDLEKSAGDENEYEPDDDDDEKDEDKEKKIEEEDDDEENINTRYHLKDVDINELRAYIKSINVDGNNFFPETHYDLIFSGSQRDDPRRYIQNPEKEYLHHDNEEWKFKYEQLLKEYNNLKNGILQEQGSFKISNDYENRIKSLEKKNIQYKDEIKTLNIQLENLQNSYQVLENKINENKRLEAEKVNPILIEKQDLIFSNEEKQNQINRLEIENQSLKKKLEIYQNKNAEIINENQNLKNQIDESEFSHDDNLILIDQLRRENKNLNRLKDENASTIEKLRNEIENIRKEIDDNAGTINTLRGENVLLNTVNEENILRIEKLRKEIDDNAGIINTLRGENVLLNTANKENIEKLRKEIDDNAGTINTLRGENVLLKTANEENIEKLKQMSVINFDLERKTRDFVQTQQNLLEQINNLEKENQQFKNQLTKNKRPKSQIISSKSSSSIPDNNDKEKNYKQCFINGFNSLDILSQQISISEILKKSGCFKLNLAISNINNFLNYLLKLDDIPERLNCLQIPTDHLYSQKIDSSVFYSELNRIYIRWEATEILYRNRCFDEPELVDLLDKFDDTIIEINSSTDYFDEINRIIISKIKMAKISIFITGVNETDVQRFKNNKEIDFVTIDSTVTIIKGGIISGSFSSCYSLKNIIIPSSVKIIESSAFSCCYSLRKVIIPSSVETIQSHAFNGCKSLKEVVLHNAIKSIESHVFFGCTSLTKIFIPTSITSIGKQTFYNCKSLSKILIPCKINLIEEEAFFNCTSLKSIDFKSPKSENNEDIVNLIIDKNAFKSCESLKELRFPSHLDKIDVSAFSDCTNLIAMTFISNVSLIGKNAFDNCPITEVTLPKSIEKMFSRAKNKEYGIKTRVEVYTK